MAEDDVGDGEGDAALLTAFRDGDEAAFERLVARHRPLILATCLRILHHSHDAEDATQAVLIALARRAAELADHPSLPAWLHRAAWNVSTRALRERRRRRQRDDVVSRLPRAAATAPSAPREELDRALEELPETYRVPIIMHHLEGRTAAEIARHLGIGESAVTMRLTRGRERLRRRLGGRMASIVALLPQLGRPEGGASSFPAEAIAASERAQRWSRAADPSRRTAWLGGIAALVALVLAGLWLATLPPAAAAPVASPTPQPAAVPDAPVVAAPAATREGYFLFGATGRAVLQGDAVVDASGRMVIAAMLVSPGSDETSFIDPLAGVARLTPAGQLDEDFGAGGWAALPRVREVFAIEALADGFLLIGAERVRSDRVEAPVLLGRLDLDGQPVRSFGVDGWRELPVFHGTVPHRPALARDRRGRIVVAGHSPSEGWGLFPGHPHDPGARAGVVVRLDADGRLDAGFGEAGVAALPAEPPSVLTQLVVLDDDSVIAAGYRMIEEATGTGDAGAVTRPVLARWTADGQRDAGFAADLEWPADSLPGALWPRAGGFTVLGVPVAGKPLFLRRLRPDGSLERHSDTPVIALRHGGIIETGVPLGDGAALYRPGAAIEGDRGGDVHLVGADGAYDTRFARGGRFVHEVGGHRHAVYSLHDDGDGGLFAVGMRLEGDKLFTAFLTVSRHRADGSLRGDYGKPAGTRR